MTASVPKPVVLSSGGTVVESSKSQQLVCVLQRASVVGPPSSETSLASIGITDPSEFPASFAPGASNILPSESEPPSPTLLPPSVSDRPSSDTNSEQPAIGNAATCLLYTSDAA